MKLHLTTPGGIKVQYQTEHLTPAFVEAEKNILRTRTRDEDEKDFNTLAGESGSGSSAPGALRASHHQENAVPTSDAAGDATQAGQSPNQTGVAQDAPGPCGRGAAGDPPTACVSTPMNHPAVEISNADGGVRSAEMVTRGTRHSRRLTTEQLTHGQLALAKWEAVRKFRAENPTADWKRVKKETGVGAVQFCRWNKVVKKASANWAATPARSELVAALAKKSPPGRAPKYAFSETEAATVAANNLQSNRSMTAGSPQEATRHALKCGVLSAECGMVLQQRQAEGKPLLTTSMRRQIEVGETTVRGYRTPRGAWLQYVQSPGSLQITVDETTGEERMFLPGEMWTIDDATINLILTVPIERPGDKCWDNFGVMVGRFQFIVPADHRSYFIPGFSFTARPRSSYRAEDLTATMHTAFREHGMPRGMFLEMGISKAKLVHETLRRAGIKIQHVHSPHQKVIETLFNKLWTKLSFLPGQVGRNMQDDEEMTKLLMSCRAGATDPRKYFLPLDVVVKALEEAIQEHNAQRILHSRYGKWIPNEFWSAKSKEILRPLDPDSEWMFAPVVSPELTVHGFTVKTTVRLIDPTEEERRAGAKSLSQEFAFAADWMDQFHTAKVRLHYNPFLDAPAKVILAQDFKGFKADSILGDAPMTDRHARLNLRALQYGEFPDIGKGAVRSQAQALVRAVKSVRPDGKPGITSIETRSASKSAAQRERPLDTFADSTRPAPAPVARHTQDTYAEMFGG